MCKHKKMPVCSSSSVSQHDQGHRLGLKDQLDITLEEEDGRQAMRGQRELLKCQYAHDSLWRFYSNVDSGSVVLVQYQKFSISDRLPGILSAPKFQFEQQGDGYKVKFLNRVEAQLVLYFRKTALDIGQDANTLADCH